MNDPIVTSFAESLSSIKGKRRKKAQKEKKNRGSARLV